ncbi:NADH-quinone oxidoreductase subunit L [Polaromonas sp.]|uniref:NADH-quinone oxidoreductase subunit L n=1 Tax=Polaromonas sp. TaxID=1869339 RepID=UPI0035653B29
MNAFFSVPAIGLPVWHAVLVWAPALLTGLAALLVWAKVGTGGAWRAARIGSLAALVAAAFGLFAVALGAVGVGYGARADGVGALVMLLVAFVGWVIVRYSQTYLQGERREVHYVRWLLATLAAVLVVVATDHLLVLALAWTATSLTLHHLLTFFGDRPAAVVAAHKKFIVARLADICMLSATALLWMAYGTPHIHAMLAQAVGAPLPGTVQFAVLLLACTAVLKCAQLPFHGWLIQVMEAPTPVSALLHAGIVNLGGFVLLRFAPLVSEVPAAQALLVVVGAATAVLAALVMTTRISIKVTLAWSTCAQMGFMLMQCGLGAWDMALLHLLAHSLYKAYAFLGAGGAVRRAQMVQLTPQAPAVGLGATLVGAVTGVAMVLAAGALWSLWAPDLAASPAMWVLAGIVSLALVPLLRAQSQSASWLALAGGALGVALAYFGLHVLLGGWLGVPEAQPRTVLWMGAAIAFLALFALQSAIMLAPRGTLAQRLYPWFYGGLFLDGKFNSLAFALWAPPAPALQTTPLPVQPVAAAIASSQNPDASGGTP